jgi:uncharacterized protein (TIGR02145 family)
MALIKCPECNTEVSDRADACVNCGCPINKQADAQASSPALTTPVSGDVRLEEPAVTPLSWKKPKASLIAVAVFLLIAAIMNPSERTHQSVVATYCAKKIQNDYGMDLVDLMGSAWMDVFFALTIERQNYIFFSLTRDKPRDEIIGFGVFRNVWLFAGVLNGMAQGAMPMQQNSSRVGGGSGTFTDRRDRKTYKTVVIGRKRTITDRRDGKTYKTAVIGGKRWMTENLNYNGGSWCYENREDNCKKYGGLYDWKTAMKVCITGWHLPTNQEWDDLVTAAGGEDVAGNTLKTASGWNDNGNGTKDFGFSALPGGYRGYNGDFYNAGYGGYWWTATEDDGSLAYRRHMGYDHDRVSSNHYDKRGGISVRCVKDE